MKEIEVIYSPICEASGAMLGKLRKWLKDTDVHILVYPFPDCPQRLRDMLSPDENCFTEVFFHGNRIDSVPLHKAVILRALGIPTTEETRPPEAESQETIPEAQLLNAFASGELSFHPITRDTFREEMSMCLCHYPFGNPPAEFHRDCIEIKSKVFEEVWETEELAGIYAKYRGTAAGLLEVMPREVLKKYGFMTGSRGDDRDYMTVGCYEVARSFPRVQMIDFLMRQLETLFPRFHRNYMEGIGIYGWDDGFNPYWVYPKYGFTETERLSETAVVLTRRLTGMR